MTTDPNTSPELRAIYRDMRYVTGIPREPLPEGRVLVHNHVVPARRLGDRGFRAWTETLGPRLVVCGCDWANVDLHGLTHYRIARR